MTRNQHTQRECVCVWGGLFLFRRVIVGYDTVNNFWIVQNRQVPAFCCKVWINLYFFPSPVILLYPTHAALVHSVTGLL